MRLRLRNLTILLVALVGAGLLAWTVPALLFGDALTPAGSYGAPLGFGLVLDFGVGLAVLGLYMLFVVPGAPAAAPADGAGAGA